MPRSHCVVFVLLAVASQASKEGAEGGKGAQVICPFLSTLVNEGILVGHTHKQHDLLEVTLNATGNRGISYDEIHSHVDLNYRYFPDGTLDITKMDGYPNEHRASTGINDCHTDFGHCHPLLSWPKVCPSSQTARCQLPNKAKFDRFLDLITAGSADTNIVALSRVKKIMTEHEMLVKNDLIVDANPVAVNPPTSTQYLAGWDLLVQIFGETENSISKDRLHMLVIQRKFPVGYTYPNSGPSGASAKSEMAEFVLA